MADVDVRKQSSSEQRGQSGQQLERSRQGLTRRGAYPSIFDWSPSEFFSASPFALMRRFSDEMDRMFEGRRGELAPWSPAVEVSERDGKLEIRADLPGLNEKDVKVEVTDEGLIIQGERKREHEEHREGYHRSERSYGQFYRVIPLPEGANVDQARAEFRNGELRVNVPVPQQQRKSREIPISAGSAERRDAGSETSRPAEQAKRAG
jgi:HSP20 family protein